VLESLTLIPRFRFLLPLLFLTPLQAGCVESFEPDVGPLQNALCSNEDTDPDVDVSFRNEIIPLVFAPEPLGCLQCHAPNAPTSFGFEVSGLDLSSLETARRGGGNSDGIAIIPGQPCESVLYQKVSVGPPFGSRMPLGGPPYLSKSLLQLVHDWIAEGANDN
jgi:hypothetical protein